MDTEEARARWPYAKEIRPETLQTREGNVSGLHIDFDGISFWVRHKSGETENHERIDRQNREAKFVADFVGKYPYLYPWVMDDEPFHVSGLWVRRNSRDAEAIDTDDIDLEDPVALEALNLEAGKAVKGEDWFMCGNCNTAKPPEEYGYYYFSERRCKTCADPAWLKKAKSESYN